MFLIRRFNSKSKKMRITTLGVILSQVFVVSICSNCTTFNLSNGKKYRNYSPVKDIHVVSSIELDSCKFNLERFLNPDTSGVVQFLFPENIQQIVNKTQQDLLLIFNFPNCSGADKEFELAKFAEVNNIPYLLISDTYSPRRMKELYRRHDLKNRNYYILPTKTKKDKFILRKRLEFIKDVSPDNYAIYKDELIFTTLMKVSTDKTSQVNPIIVGGYRYKEFLIEWIRKEYGIEK
ncbi:hypothetical protein D3C87_278290 [compost metagenome]